ncbi:hypothetical protein [Actinoplanes sp. DH11]|uniref:hypothetical protein n=1 Tax=Actinoplanes sp. DH11 TaxID=2857011 RepID=UPI001E5E4737|nr:hypothetical protein [Actinoplanes sp. DH11]
MTAESISAGDDPRRLLADVRGLAQRVRLDQRVTWLPLLVLGLVSLGAIVVHRLTSPELLECQAMPDGSQVCQVWFQAVQIYWWVALVAAYVLIAVGYRRVARKRGLGTRMWPYVITGVALVVISAAVSGVWGVLDNPYFPDVPPASVQFLLRLADPTGAIGVALLVLAWLERRPALLIFTVGYLVVALTPINFGWGEHWGSNWEFAPQLVINGGLLLLGSAGFLLAHRLRRPR